MKRKISITGKKPRDYGQVIISKNCSLVSVELCSGKDPNSYQIYTVDSDFMIRSWNLADDG